MTVLDSEKKLIEAVPNFSTSDPEVVSEIKNIALSVEGVRVLHIDIGKSANRTVFTFIGAPSQVLIASFKTIETATRLIDMRLHHGTHPRIGAVDVFPLIPIRGISMDEVVDLARELAKRVGVELQIPVYCYGFSAFYPERVGLENCRKGEYEGIPAKLTNPSWIPDFGPSSFNPQSGISVIGARDILVAFNINLNTKDLQIARQIASEIRESGKIVNENGQFTRKAGCLKGIKAIGWYSDEYQCVQVSTNIIDHKVTPIYMLFEEVKYRAKMYGVEVTGSELIGMVPRDFLVNTGVYYSKCINKITNDEDYIRIAMENIKMVKSEKLNLQILYV